MTPGTEHDAAEATVPTPRTATPQIDKNLRKQPNKIRKISTQLEAYLRPTSGEEIRAWQKIAFLVVKAVLSDILKGRASGDYFARIEEDGMPYSLVGTLDEWMDLLYEFPAYKKMIEDHLGQDGELASAVLGIDAHLSS